MHSDFSLPMQSGASLNLLQMQSSVYSTILGAINAQEGKRSKSTHLSMRLQLEIFLISILFAALTHIQLGGNRNRHSLSVLFFICQTRATLAIIFFVSERFFQLGCSKHAAYAALLLIGMCFLASSSLTYDSFLAYLPFNVLEEYRQSDIQSLSCIVVYICAYMRKREP